MTGPRTKKAAAPNWIVFRAAEGDLRNHDNERHAGCTPRWGSRGASFPIDARPRQTRGSVRGDLPDYRHHAVELHQLGSAAGVHPDAVQGAFPEPAYPRRLERERGAGTGRVRGDPAADAAGERELVYGDRGRGVPEHLLDWGGAAEVRDHPVGRSHLQDELRADARAPQADGRGCDAGDLADPAG